MISSVRTRLTLWYVGVLAAVLVLFAVGVYGFFAQSLYDRADSELRVVQQVAVTSLEKDAEEGDSVEVSAETTARELLNPPQRVTIYDGAGRLLADNAIDEDEPPLPPPGRGEPGEVVVYTVPEEAGDDDLLLVAAQLVAIAQGDREFVVVASQPLEPITDELDTIWNALAYSIPVALALAGIGGWYLARRSLAPAVAMSEEARRIGAEDLRRRLPVANPRDELGRLATNFNELLGRLHEAFWLQRQFMADASHELRTPLSVVGTAVEVTLEKEGRSEAEYREALELVGEQNRRLARTVEDMFTLARADAGRYPLRREGFYLDETVEEAARAARVLGSRRGVDVTSEAFGEAPFAGDEDLVRQMVMNLLDNAVKHTPEGGSVRATLARNARRYVLTVEDTGSGIPAEARPHVFERFYRVDRARSRAEATAGGGAGLGLPIARWIAEAHGGALDLARSDERGTAFRVTLPAG
jgi:heavy metal sensor kinase